MLKLADLAVREDFTFGPLWVSPSLRLIRGPAGELHVEPLIMQVFLFLVDAKGQVVTRNRLYDECWGGVHVGDYSLNRAITMVRRIAAEAGPGAFTIESIPRTGYRLLVGEGSEPERSSTMRDRRMPALAGATVLIALAVAAWLLEHRQPDEPSAVVEAADSRSTELTAGISSTAMTTAATYQAPLRILDSGNRRADFVLRVRQAGAGNARSVDLTLLSGANEALVWTWSARPPAYVGAALDQAARDVGAQALACAAETRVRGGSTDQETVKLYVDACTKFGPWFSAQLTLLADAFERVTEQAPQMPGAWSKLFLSKAEAIEGYPPADVVQSLKNDLRNSVAHGIDVPETYVAKAAVLPLNARFERLQLYEAGLARYPSNPFLLSARSWQLRSVGRMNEAARTAQRLAFLYPSSSAANTEFANSLMTSGRSEQARNVLDRAAKVTPGAPNIGGARWRFEMRYGDPAEALRIARSGAAVVDQSTISFLEARINPTKANVDRAIEDLMADYRADPHEPGLIAQALGTFGRREDAVRLLLAYDDRGRSGDGAEMLFRPHMRDIRRDPRFMLIAKNFGITDYWIRSGILPDFCFEPDVPYDCKRALAALARQR